MGIKLQISCGDKDTKRCSNFYGYCDYKDAKESFDFLIELNKQGKLKFEDWTQAYVDDNEPVDEIFKVFTYSCSFGVIYLSNEDFIKFINLHNREAWIFWNGSEELYNDWEFKKQCDELAKLPKGKYLIWY